MAAARIEDFVTRFAATVNATFSRLREKVGAGL
jgi:hypothetical protein